MSNAAAATAGGIPAATAGGIPAATAGGISAATAGGIPVPFQQMAQGFDLAQAIAEADRCLLCHDAPCSKGCPAETDPGTFLRKLRLRNVTGAIRTIKTNNILGGACGVLCPTPRLCEKACSAAGLNRPVEIGKIQRALVEHGWKIGFRPFPSPPRP